MWTAGSMILKYDDVATSGLTKCLRLQHYICWSELPVPRIAVTFSLQEVEEIEKDCAVYRGRLERIAKHCAISREEQVHRHMCIVPTCDMCKCLYCVYFNIIFWFWAHSNTIMQQMFVDNTWHITLITTLHPSSSIILQIMEALTSGRKGKTVTRRVITQVF